MVDKQTIALFALPAHAHARFAPGATKLVELLFHFGVAGGGGFDVAGIAGGPFGALGGLAGTLGAADVVAGIADGGGGGGKQRLALVAASADALFGGLEGELGAGSCGEGEDFFAVDSLDDDDVLVEGGVCFLVLGFGLVVRLLLGRVAWTLFAALVVALFARLVCAVQTAAAMTAAVHTHANRLLYALDDGHGRRGGNPVMGF